MVYVTENASDTNTFNDVVLDIIFRRQPTEEKPIDTIFDRTRDTAFPVKNGFLEKESLFSYKNGGVIKWKFYWYTKKKNALGRRQKKLNNNKNDYHSSRYRNLSQHDIFKKQNHGYNIISYQPQEFDEYIRKYPKLSLEDKD